MRKLKNWFNSLFLLLFFLEALDMMNEEDVLEAFHMMDSNQDGRLTLDEFITGVQMNPLFVNMLNSAYAWVITYKNIS